MKVKKLTIAISLMIASMSVSADIKQMADDFWNDTKSSSARVSSAGGGQYNSANQSVLYGPSLRMRVPVKKITLWNVTPPRINAGCNGIDLYMGSFSFISGDQLKQLVRSTMEGIPSYAFSIAIAHLCPTCESKMQELAKMANEAAKFMQDSCSLSKDVVEKSGLGDAIRHGATTIKAGLSGDGVSTGKDLNEVTKSTVNPEKDVAPELVEQNLTWSALKDSKVASWFSSVSGTGSLSDYELIMSMTGTVIGRLEGTDKEIKVYDIPATLEPDVFINGSTGTNAQIIKCGPSTSSIDIGTCVDATVINSTIEIPSLVEKISGYISEMELKMGQRGAGSELSTEALEFSNIDPLSTLNFIRVMSKGGAYKSFDLSGENSQIIAEYIVYTMMLDTYKTIRISFKNSDKGTRALREKTMEMINDRIKASQNRLSALERKLQDKSQYYLKVMVAHEQVFKK